MEWDRYTNIKNGFVDETGSAAVRAKVTFETLRKFLSLFCFLSFHLCDCL
jgi:hypothetical protein